MLAYRDNHLYFEGRRVGLLADKLRTPFFLISENRLRANYQALTRGLSSPQMDARIRYCAKTNNESGVLEILAACGSQILVSHPAEAQLALSCGFPPDKVAYQRPVLREDEIQLVLDAGIDFLCASRPSDLDIIETTAHRLGKKTKISLRLRNGSRALRLSPLGFLSRRHGFSRSEILLAAERIRSSRWMSLVAVNFYQGTQQESVSNYRPLLRRAMKLAVELHARTGITLDEINLGGGIPSPSLHGVKFWNLIHRFKDHPKLLDPVESLEGFARSLSVRFCKEAQRAGLQSVPALAAEPGRAIVGNACILVSRVHAGAGKWLFLDASRNHLGESPLLFARTILPVTRTGTQVHRHYHLSGCTLNTMDFIDFRRRLPLLAEGELLALCDAGAYSISRASRYAGLSPAVYLLQADGALRMIRRPENLSDLLGAASNEKHLM